MPPTLPSPGGVIEKVRKKRKSQEVRNRRGRAGVRGWRVRLLAVVCSPILLLAVGELTLWLVGYGHSTSFFIPWKTSAQTLYLGNSRYGEHFVPKDMARPPETSALGRKGESSIRVFVLGSSAAYGDPEPSNCFCRQLELLLNEHASGKSFEVINAAMPAMTSHVIRRIARDCARQQPDLFIVYTGNNEVVGPYGPVTLPDSLYSSRGFINACITAKKETRLGQLAKNIGQSLRPKKKWQDMEAFRKIRMAADDPKLKDCYRHFGDNLDDIIATARHAGAGVVLCTVPTNIRSCAPFASQHRTGLTADEAAQWDRLFQEGRSRERAGDFAGALSAYGKAARIDDSYADLAFCMGRCLVALGRTEDAAPRFIHARDRDVLRLRADSALQEIIRATAQTHAGQGVRLLDLEADLQGESQNHLLGDDLLFDYVHLNFRGNFLASRAALRLIREMMPQAGLREPVRSEAELLDLCRQRLLYDERKQYELAMVMYRRKTLPPYVGQIDHERELERLGDKLIQLRRTQRGLRDSEATYLDAIRQRPLDTHLVLRHGQFLAATGRFREAFEVYRKALDAKPFDLRIRVALAQVLCHGSARKEAIRVLTSSQTPNRYSRKDALLLLGAHCIATGNIPEAMAIYEELGRIDPKNVEVLSNQAAAALQRNDLMAMKQYLDKALALDPGSVEALSTMGAYHATQRQPREAQEWFAKAVQADPQSPYAHFGLAVQSVALDQRGEGLEHATRAAALKPDFPEARLLLADLLSQAGRNEEAKQQTELAALFNSAP